MGVAFGGELQETIQKAKDRVANQPRMNIVLPAVVPVASLPEEPFMMEKELIIINEELPPLNDKPTSVLDFSLCKRCKERNCPNRGKPQPTFELYQSAKLPGKQNKSKNGPLAPDMTCGDFNFAQIYKLYYESFDLENENSQFWRDELQYIANKNSDFLFKTFRELGVSCSIWKLEKIVLDLIEHFRTENGRDYENDTLSKHVRNHKNTKTYVNSVWEKFKVALPYEKYNLNKTKENEIFDTYITQAATRPQF